MGTDSGTSSVLSWTAQPLGAEHFPVHEVHRPVPLAAIRLRGEFDRRIRLGLGHLLAERERILGGEGFGSAWGADQFGRWIAAVAQASVYTGEPVPSLPEVVEVGLHAQAKSGFFGSALNSSTWWGAGRALIGLLECWEATNDPGTLTAAVRLGDFYLANLPLEGPGLATHHGGHEEGLVALWRATGNTAFLRLAERLPATVDREFGGPGIAAPNHHTHSYLSTMRGCVDLYLATGNAEYLARAQATWQHVLEHNMWASGGISEGSAYPFETRDETCSVADWLRLSLKLWQATGDPLAMEVAEHVLLNHLCFDQDHSGGFCTFRSVSADESRHTRDVVAWFCCSMSGLRALLEATRFIYTTTCGAIPCADPEANTRSESISVNLFISSEAVVPLGGSKVRLRQQAELPKSTRLEVEPEEHRARFTLRLRIPRWAQDTRLTINGSPVAARVGAYVALDQTWSAGDVVRLEFTPALRVIPEGRNGFQREEREHTTGVGWVSQAVLQLGPLVLMLDPVLSIYDMFDWARTELLVPCGEDGKPQLVPAPALLPGRRLSGTGLMTLARRADGHAPDVNTNRALSGWDAAECRLAFLVPIAELTDRWTYTLNRHCPYEVRNDLLITLGDDRANYERRVTALCQAYLMQRGADTIA